MARRVDAGRVGEAVVAQADATLAWLSMQPPSAWRKPSALAGWTVAELAAHISASLANLPLTLGRSSPDKPITLDRYVSGYASAAGQILERDIGSARDREPAEILAGAYEQREATAAALADLPVTRAVQAPRGPIGVGDYLVTRAIEMVVHADDLSRSLPDRPPVELERTALRIVTHAFTDLLAARAPGRSLELRVPPYAAVQCVEGPRHTRGTPPNVVETDPVTWIRLAAGRLTWAEAVEAAAVSANGGRADLAPWLPLL